MTNYYGFPPGYDPNPHHPRPSVPAAEIPANIKHRASGAGASHISQDGRRAYVKRFEQWYQMDWLGTKWGCWWPADDKPEGAVRL